jgi:hypothetical protein
MANPSHKWILTEVRDNAESNELKIHVKASKTGIQD